MANQKVHYNILFQYGMPMPLPSRQKTLKHYYMFYLIDNPYFRDNRVADNYLQKGGVTYLRNAPKPMFEAIPIVESKWHSSRKERRKNRFNKPMELTSTEFIRIGGAK